MREAKALIPMKRGRIANTLAGLARSRGRLRM